uniref:Alpha-defensin N-terminal domain-containing protein n=1 Tax=Oryctolagus cuniculus TaxID=9986 RepID=A0A5F9C7E8_RABIT
MRTFILLTAIVLVALQAKAEPVPPSDEEIPDQEGTDVGGQVMAISFAEDETSALQNPVSPLRSQKMFCRCKKHCDPWMVIDGRCGLFNYKYVCCGDRPGHEE